MRKFINLTLVLCCGLLWNVSAQDAIASVTKPDCPKVTACCASAATAVKATSDTRCTRTASTAMAQSEAVTQLVASTAALFSNPGVPANCNPSNCDPSNCDPQNCDKKNCDPNDCPKVCKRLCPAPCAPGKAADKGRKL